MAVKKITEESFEQEVLESKKTVLLDFYADWCAPCRAVAPIVEEISNEKEDVLFFKINIDDSPELAARFDVMSIPTLIVMKGSKIVKTSVGTKGKQEILAML